MKRTVTVPIYKRRLHFVDSWEEYESVLKALRTERQKYHTDSQEPQDPQLPVYGAVEMGYNEIVMCVVDGQDETVSHEAVHVATTVLSYAGVDAGLENDEPIAYLTGWVVRQWQEKMT